MASLGCAKNLVDAETMLGETLDDEFALALDPAEADVIIINTCGFIQDARDEAREVLREYLDVKRRSRRNIKVVAAGCWAQRAPEEMLREFPTLDAVWGLDIPSSLAQAIRDLTGKPEIAGIGRAALPREGARLLTTLPSYAYLRISDGCDNRCHYCAIPLIRGGLKSRHPSAILNEAISLEEQGASELVVISQDTTAYGNDRPEWNTNLASLLNSLLSAVKVPRIRLLYAHPAHLDDEVMDLLLREPRLCRYLDLPIQHVSDCVLDKMGRGYGRQRIMDILERLSSGDITIRTTILTGFPGETDDDIRQVLELVSAGHFRHLGAFAYSPEPDTPAFVMDSPVAAEIAAQRRDAVLEAQTSVAFAWLDSRVGGTEAILADYSPRDGWLAGRSIHEAPDADGLVYVKDGGAEPGDIVIACIKEREGYDLLAERPSPHKQRGKKKR